MSGITIYGSGRTPCCPFRYIKAVSDQEGRFELKAPGKFLHVRADGFRPVTIPASTTKEIRVDLTPDEDMVALPKCASKRRNEMGYFFKFQVPRGAKRIRDIDYVLYIASHGNSKLEVWSGPNVGGYDATEKTFAESDTFSERSIILERQRVGIDAGGMLKNGRRWRNFGLMGEALATYYDVPEDAAAVFDEVISSVCVSPS